MNSWNHAQADRTDKTYPPYYWQDGIGGITVVRQSRSQSRVESAYESQSQSTENDPPVVYRLPEPRLSSSSRHSAMSSHPHISKLLYEREMILKKQEEYKMNQRYYVESMTKAVSDQKNYGAHSPEYQDLQNTITNIMEQMYLKMGTPEDARKRNRQWHSRLMDIEDSIRDYQKQAGMHSPGSPESQISGIPGSSQWSSPPLSTTESMASFSEPSLSSERVPRHHLNAGDSSLFENESESTGSSGARKDPHLYGSGGLINSFSELMYIPRTSSTLSNEELDHAAVYEAMRSQANYPRQHQHRRPRVPYNFSQESEFPYLSQPSMPSRSFRHYNTSSPGSSDNLSIASSAQRRLRSGPASEDSFSSYNLSQSTNSSTRSYNGYRLPRIAMNPRHYPTVHEIEPHASGKMTSSLSQGYHSPEQDPRLLHHPQHNGPPIGMSSHEGRKYPHQAGRKSSPEQKSEHEFSKKVMSFMSALSTNSHSDEDVVRIILALSQSSETSMVMSESNCTNQLVNILHKIKLKGSQEHFIIRAKAAEALRNIVKAGSGTRRGKCEASVLSSLEKVRNHCEKMFAFIYNYKGHQVQLDPILLDELQKSCNDLMVTLRKIFKYSSDKQMYRSAVLALGGLQAMAEILVVDSNLPTQPDNVKIISHSPDIICITITTLINLTYGDSRSKLLLCAFPHFLHALIGHMYSNEEVVLSKGAQVLRNLSCRASSEIKDALLKCNAIDALMAAINNAEGETTTQHITSALWNISAHSLENRHHICRTQNGIPTLVTLLSYNSQTGATVVVENVGGILRNLSSVISLQEGYRKQFREAGGLAKLVQHLKSKNKTVLSNATGILWNLSARCPEDQKLLWDLGCVPLLDVLQTSPSKNIGENARAALRNLLAFGQTTSIGQLSTRQRKPQPKSKSTTTLPFTLHSQPTSPVDYEAQSGRRSAPQHTDGAYPSQPTQMQYPPEIGLLRSRSEAGSRNMYHKVKDEDSSGEEFPQAKPSTRKFSRVGSAPQPHNEEEWRNYRPERTGMDELRENSKFSHSGHKRQHHPSHSQQMRMGQLATHSLSQTEPYETSELQSMSATNYALSPSLSIGAPSGQAEVNVDYQYDELDVDLEYEEQFQHEKRNQLRSSGSQPRHLSEVDYNMAANHHYPSPSHRLPSHLSVMDDAKIYTHSLSLDGTAPKEEHINHESPLRQHSRLSTSTDHSSHSPIKELT